MNLFRQSLENEELATLASVNEPAVAAVVVMDFSAAGVETDLAGLAEDEADAVDHALQVEEAGQVIEALEALNDIVRASFSTGGLDKNAASMLNISVQHMYKRVGYVPKSSIAIESFNDDAARLSSSKLALEGINEGIKRIWQAIIAAINKSIEWAKKFFSKLFVSWEELEKRADDLFAKADLANGKGTVKNNRIAKELYINSDFTLYDHNKLVTALNNFEKFARGIFSQTTGNHLAISSMIEIVCSTNDAALKRNEGGIFIPKYSTWFNMLSEASGQSFSEPGDNLYTYRSDEQFGGAALIAVLPKTDLRGKMASDAISDISFKIGKYNPEASEPVVEEINVISGVGIKDITTAVKGISKLVLGTRNYLKENEKEKNKLIEAAKKFSEDAENNADSKKIILGLLRNIDQPGASANMYALRTCKALLDYCELSIRHKEE